MPIRVECPTCRKTISAPERFAGNKAKCPGCAAAVTIPALPTGAPPPPPPVTPPPKPFDPLDVLGAAPARAAAPLEVETPITSPRPSSISSARAHVARGAFICADCGSFTDGKKVTPGRFWVELILWCFMIFPGAIYTIWRLVSKYRACTVCGGKNLVPSVSPRGRELADRFG